MLKRAALGFRVHSGWAAVVALGEASRGPAVIFRRRIEIADAKIAGSVQPFHAAAEMKLHHAERYLERCRLATASMAEAAVQQAAADLADAGCKVAGACVLRGSGRALGALAQTLAAHPLIHTAEGEFFRDAVGDACQSCSLKLRGVKEKEIWDEAARSMRISVDDVCRRVSELGKTLGPPWRQDEKLSALAAWLMLL